MGRAFTNQVARVVVGVLIIPLAGWGQRGKERMAAVTAPVAVEEIAVTAYKREENIQEIPVSVTALTGPTLEEKWMVKLRDLMASVPNLRTEQSSASTASFLAAMRSASLSWAVNTFGPQLTDHVPQS